MKKIKFVLSLFLIGLIVIFVANFFNNSKTATGSSFLVKEMLSDVNNDNLADKIQLFGRKTNVDDTEFLDFELIVTDGDTQMRKKFAPSFLKGANPSVGLYDFTGDKKPEIMLTAEDGNRILTSIANLEQDIIKPLFQEADNEGVRLNLSFGDSFSLNGSFADGKKLAVNLSHIKPALTSYGIYTEDGAYKEKDTPSITPYTSLIAMDIENDGIFELLGTQTIITKNSALPLCNLISVHKYNNGFKLTDIKYTR